MLPALAEEGGSRWGRSKSPRFFVDNTQQTQTTDDISFVSKVLLGTLIILILDNTSNFVGFEARDVERSRTQVWAVL